MRRWIGAALLTALVVAGGIGTIDVAAAAKIITVPQRVRAAHAADLTAQGVTHRTYRQARYGAQPYAGGWTYYYGRPFYYVPAPFPLGFDFGFGW
jgi:hypothetical protein